MKYQLKNIIADPGNKITFFTECDKEIAVNLGVDEGKKRAVCEVISVDEKECKVIYWTLKELTIE